MSYVYVSDLDGELDVGVGLGYALKDSGHSARDDATRRRVRQR